MHSFYFSPSANDTENSGTAVLMGIYVYFDECTYFWDTMTEGAPVILQSREHILL